LLVDNGCPGIDDADIDEWTPLAWAIQNNSPEIVSTLLSTGQVNLERRDHSGRTALSWAVEYGHYLVVKVLLEAGADPEATNETGRTPVSVAQDYEREDLVQALQHYIYKRRS
jgi:ankyrin repeat protein